MWPDREAQIEGAVFKGYTREQRQNVDILSEGNQITVLECWYRLGDDGETIAKADILIGDNSGDTPNGTVLLDTDETKYPDIPVRITPRLKVPDRTPDESTGALQAIAGPVTEYAEILSSYKDMTNALVYPRFVASGFTYRNAPRLDRTIGGVIPLPRSDQRLQRLEETMNTTPPEQLLAHEEELIVLFAGLSPHFLGRAPSAGHRARPSRPPSTPRSWCWSRSAPTSSATRCGPTRCGRPSPPSTASGPSRATPSPRATC